jgi:hypothetical protein
VVIDRDGASSRILMVPGVPQKLTMLLRDLLVVAEADLILIECRRSCCCPSERSSRKGMVAGEADCGNLMIVSEILD